MKSLKPHLIFLILTIAFVAAISIPELTYYPLLSQGDHGRDLYAAQAILRGEMPYKNFWWVYGPLMPFYYAFFYKFLGTTIGSILIGKMILKILCAVFFYWAAALFMPAFIAFLGALWFVQSQQDFFFTFNHIGGIAAELWVLLMLFSYVSSPQMRFLWNTIPALLLYCLIKINFGLVGMLVVALIALGTDYYYKIPFSQEKKKFYTLLGIYVPLCVGIIYWLLLKDLPFYAIRQCFPYFGDDQPHHFPPSVTIPYYLTQHWLTAMHTFLDAKNVYLQNWGSSFVGILIMTMHVLNVLKHVILHGATLMVIWLFLTKKINSEEKTKLYLLFTTLGLFFVLNFHEFVVSGVWYRTFWSLPFLFMFHLIAMATGFRILPQWAKNTLWSIFGSLLALGAVITICSTQSQQTPQRYLSGAHAKIFTGNEEDWTLTVNTVSGFLNENLKKDELFLALPYDCIYYYLTNRPSPTRQLIFFDHIKIPPQQEMAIIEELKSKNVKFVLMSNRISSSETGLGTFGKTYCPLLSQYINQNYLPLTRQGGDWQKEPGWGNNHGVLIFKHK